jgi:hypothetical protein
LPSFFLQVYRTVEMARNDGEATVGNDAPGSEATVGTTIIICPGPLVHSMNKMSWRNDYGGEGMVRPAFQECVSLVILLLLASWFFKIGSFNLSQV